MQSPALQTVEEKRKFARLDIALAVSYAVKQSNGETSDMAEAMSSDISAGGIRLMTPSPLNPGDILDLEIAIDGESAAKNIKASGEVVWQNKINDKSFETGAVIKHIDEQDKHYLMVFVFDQIAKMVGIKTTGFLH